MSEQSCSRIFKEIQKYPTLIKVKIAESGISSKITTQAKKQENAIYNDKN